MLSPLRASKPGNLVSVVPCNSHGLRLQVEFRGKAKVKWALEAIQTQPRPCALIDHEGRIVAKSPTWPE